MLDRVDFFPELLADQMINNILNIVSQVRRLKNQARVLGIICHGIKVTLTYIKFANIAILPYFVAKPWTLSAMFA